MSGGPEPTDAPSIRPVAPAEPAEPAEPARFRLGPRLGQGAFGEVIRAFDRELGQWVALKRSLSGDRKALLSEYRALASLAASEHAGTKGTFGHVVRAGAWVEGSQWCGYSMGLVDGPSARHWVRGPAVKRGEDRPRRNLPMAFGQELQDVGDSRYVLLEPARMERLRCVLWDLSRALETVHRAGWLHLDVMPENVRIAGDRAVLLDLGLAMPQGAQADAGTFLGSAAYGAPELGARPPGPASDYYSLGVLAFELLLGDRPFEGGGPEVLVRKQSLEASLPSDLVAGVPPDLDEVCAGLLRRLPSQRMNGAALRQTIGPQMNGSRQGIVRPPVR